MRLSTLLVMLASLLVVPLANATDLTLQTVKVTSDVYAVIGDLGGQTYANDGLNSNLAFVIGPNGVVVINSGPSTRVAQALHDAIKKISAKPVVALINVNAQNHHWLGNGYFKRLGVPIIAHAAAAKRMQEVGAAQLESAKTLLKEKAAATELAFPTQTFSTSHRMSPGGREIELHHFGPAHTEGDIAIWLPKEKLLIAGDLVFTQRMLAVLPIGNSGGWVKAFDQALALKPNSILPGHGKLTNAQTAQRDTRDYLAYLRSSAQRWIAKGASLQDAVEKTDQAQFRYLVNFDLLAKRNMNQVYTEMEQESF